MGAATRRSAGTFFYDTSVLVAATIRAHPHRDASVTALAKATPGNGYCAAHSFAEMYATLTAIPLQPRIHPSDALAAIRHRATTLTALALSADETLAHLARASERQAISGQVYDALILAAAEKSRAETIYTWNVAHFIRFAPPNLAGRIRTPE